jgi:hypothetical protein
MVSKCKYCQGDEEDYVTSIDGYGHVYVHGDFLWLNWYGHEAKDKINFCPMCGRKLDV